jgi:tartronate-semialdehyde synthase
VVGVVGDLTFQFLIEELAVAAQHRVGFVMVLLNSAYLGLIRWAEVRRLSESLGAAIEPISRPAR